MRNDCTECKARADIAASLSKLDPRFVLEKAEIRYLVAKGWIMYCGTMKPWAEPVEPGTQPVFMTHDEALQIQKKRDV